MKSPTSRKCVQRVFSAFAALAGLVLMAACGGSSSSPPPNQQGFTNASLSGTYVFSASGTDVNGYPISIAGAFTANGSTSSPSITAGTVDIVDPFFDLNGSTPPSSAAQSISSGSYTVSTDGRGQLQLNIAVYGTYTFYFALNSTSQGVITLYDKNHGTGSGTLDLQTAITSFTAGSYAFSVAGANGGLTGPLTLAGAFNLTSSGVVSGIEDYNNNGTVDQSFVTLTGGTATLGSGTAPGQIPISTTPFPLTFDFYPIDNTHFKLIETDYIGFVSGDAFTQTGGSSIPTSSMAFTLSGDTTSGPLGLGGFMTVSGTSLSGAADVNDAGTFTGGTSFTGTATTPSTNGRVVLSTLVGPASTLVLYPSADGVVLMELDSSAVGTGLAVQTASGTINASTGYAFNLSAVNVSQGSGSFYEEDDNAQFTTNTSSGLSGIVDINDEGSLTPGQPLIGDYGSSTTSGAYSVSTGIGTSTSNATAFVNFNAYPASANQFLVLETDSTQIGTGVFFAQSTPTSGGALQAATRRIATVVRPQPALAHTLGATIKKHNN